VGHFLAFPSVERPERDLLFMRMPAVFTAHKDIRKFIIKESELPVVSGEPGRLDTARTMRDGELVPFNERVIFMPLHSGILLHPHALGVLSTGECLSTMARPLKEIVAHLSV
jgi:hypothetical protein